MRYSPLLTRRTMETECAGMRAAVTYPETDICEEPGDFNVVMSQFCLVGLLPFRVHVCA